MNIVYFPHPIDGPSDSLFHGYRIGMTQIADRFCSVDFLLDRGKDLGIAILDQARIGASDFQYSIR